MMTVKEKEILSEIDNEDIITSLSNVKKLCNVILFNLKIQQFELKGVDINSLILKVVYSPKSDVIYIYIKNERIGKILVSQLIKVLNDNKVEFQLGFQLIGEVAVIELNFGDKVMINYFKKKKIKKCITL